MSRLEALAAVAACSITLSGVLARANGIFTGMNQMDGTQERTVPELQPVVPTITVSDNSQQSEDWGMVSLSLTLSEATTVPVTVNYTTNAGTAQPRADYTTTTGTATFAPGQTVVGIEIPLVNDTSVEPNETFTLTLSNPSGATIANGSATVTILNDDVAVPPKLEINDISANSGAFNFAVTLSAVSSNPADPMTISEPGGTCLARF